jgi:hypothetical protein
LAKLNFPQHQLPSQSPKFQRCKKWNWFPSTDPV